MRYSLEKYKYYQYKNENGGTTIAAASTYAGKTVKGYAKCDPNETFDEAKGKELAAARCNHKISAKRVARAAKKYLDATMAMQDAQVHLDAMRQYYMDAVDQFDEAVAELANLEHNA